MILILRISNSLDSVFLYDIDDLEGIVEANLQERQKAAETISVFIDDAVYAFIQWINTLGVVPLISSLREKALHIQSDVMVSWNGNYLTYPNGKRKSLVNI